MKTLINFIITILISLTLTSTTQFCTKNTQKVILQSINSQVTEKLLTESAKIISDRLNSYGLESFDIKVLADHRQIIIQLPENIVLSELEGLLTYKGELAFYETFNRKEIADLLKDNNQLFDLLKSDPETSPNDSKIGCISPSGLDQTNDYIRSNRIAEYCKFVWGMKSDDSLYCLYALKINSSGNTLLAESDVETIKSTQDKSSQSFLIEIKFKPASKVIWKNATTNNLDKPIAIVIDDKVFYAPVVKVPMENGLCEISGNLTLKDVNYFLALVNNEKLPTGFSIK